MHITLFHKTNSRSQRILWLLEELNLDYELIHCDDPIPTQGFDKLPNLNSTLKFPTVQICDEHSTEVISLTETAAIADYLSHQCNSLGMAQLSSSEMLHYYFWKNFAEATLMPDLALKQIFAQIVLRTPFPVRFISKFLKFGFDQGYLNDALQQHLFRINAHLKDHIYLAGNHFSIADVLLWFPLLACTQASTKFAELLHIQRYLQKIQSRPAFQRALEKGQWSATVFQTYWSQAW
ncbi:glutathione S-transferase N-terminal domain-containing protein [Acinetobacter bouvetii]|uniref:Disulfide-bond oxidoreductase YfcG n=1 Tax=Acinetobacter bouvetii TaxID=202951 RepID=A0A811G9T1_9GAMM|nr:glutathione S-transferase N-terminal domain-containing protein [Acinetobacter bouvetii]CAB1214516.1 Disulfide-bond oxidoreductase YfcG [Acinetobacter bouvetii]